MGCAPSRLPRRRQRQIGLREEVPDLPFSTTEIEPWVISPGTYVQHDISAFISPTHSQVAMMPPENPPPYSEELQEGHIILMRGTTASKDREDVTDHYMNVSAIGTGDADMWSTSLVTSGDISIMSASSADPTANMDAVLSEREEDLAMTEELQHRLEPRVEYTSGFEPETTALGSDYSLNTANHIEPPGPTETLNVETDSNVLRHSAEIPPSYIHFYKPLHRSLSVDNSYLTLDEQLRVPSPRTQSMTVPAPLTTPFSPKVTLPPILPAPKNISPLLREGWVPEESFSRRPSRLPPLRRKRNRVSTWHGESNLIVPSESTINAVQE